MSDLLKFKGKIDKFINENCIVVINPDNKMKLLASQYNGIDPQIHEGDFIEFSYREREKDGRIWNNIVPGSIEKTKATPRDVTQDYSQSEVAAKNSLSLDKDTLIVRQSCLKAAVELLTNPKTTVSDHAMMAGTACAIAEEFEKWVFR